MYNSQKTKINQTKKKKINKKIIYIYIYVVCWVGKDELKPKAQNNILSHQCRKNQFEDRVELS